MFFALTLFCFLTYVPLDLNPVNKIAFIVPSIISITRPQEGQSIEPSPHNSIIGRFIYFEQGNSVQPPYPLHYPVTSMCINYSFSGFTNPDDQQKTFDGYLSAPADMPTNRVPSLVLTMRIIGMPQWLIHCLTRI